MAKQLNTVVATKRTTIKGSTVDKPVKPKVSFELEQLRQEKSLSALIKKILQLTGKTVTTDPMIFLSNYNKYAVVNDQTIIRGAFYDHEDSLFDNDPAYKGIFLEETAHKLRISLLSYGNGSLWKSVILVAFERELDKSHGAYYRETYSVKSFEFSKWTPVERMVGKEYVILFDGIHNKLKELYPYTFAFYQEHKNDFVEEAALRLLLCPWLEQLYKAGFVFANKFLYRSYLKPTDVETFNRLCGKGTNLNSIFKTSKAVYSALKNEESLGVWDTFRKMDKFGRIPATCIERTYNAGYSEKALSQFSSILGYTFRNKPVFSWQSLQSYLERIDMNEAIEAEEGLMLLSGYLANCRVLDMQPRLDGDSLKREHDITARIVRNQRDEILAGKMGGPCKALQADNYAESVFFVRGIQSYDDLLDEAKQQHNCVAGYAQNIISGSSRIYVMREKTKPDRSLVTIELDRKKKLIQHFWSYNRPVRNKAQTEFIHRWLKAIQK